MAIKVVFIVNPIAGGRGKKKLPQLIRKHIDNTRYVPEIVFTQYQGHARKIVCEYYEKGYRYFVAVGGDGTINEVADACRDTDAVLGIVPVGSGNGLARDLHIPMDTVDALRLFNQMEVKRIDYGLVNNKPFFCTFGIGLDAKVSRIFARSKQRGFISYFTIVLRTYWKYDAERYKINIDGRKLNRYAMLLTVANATQYGNNVYIAPRASMTDGLLDCCILRPFIKIFAPFLAAALILKQLDHTIFYKRIQGKKMQIERKQSGTVHLDGESMQMERVLNIEVVPQGLQVLCTPDNLANEFQRLIENLRQKVQK